MVTSALYPTASLYPEPSSIYGLSPEQQSVYDLAPTAAPSPTVTSPSTTAAANSVAHQQFMDYLSKVTGGAVGNDNDPSNWTPEEAAAQSDRALARIGQSNPELAQQLAEQRGKTTEDTGNFLSDIVGGIAHVAKVGVGGLLDILDRSSHIVPEIIHDWGKESVWKNVGDAVSGESDIRWHDVLRDSFGMGDSWMTAVAGFVGDVATDPLTYATFGLGGVAKSTAARLGIEVGTKGLIGEKLVAEGATSGMSILDDMVRQAAAQGVEGVTEETAAKILLRGTEAELSQKASGSVMQKFRGLLGQEVADDGWQHLAYTVGASAEDDAMRTALVNQGRAITQTTNDIWNTITTRGWSRLTAKEAAAMGIDKAAIDTQLKTLAKTGSGFFVGREAYEEGKVANALLGGVRFKLPVPMLGFRLQSRNLIPMSQKFDFQVFRRFFAGLSGGERLASMLGKGATVEDMRAFWQGGFSGRWQNLADGSRKWIPGLKDFNPEVAKQLSGGSWLHGGSVFYPLSEQVGRLTAAFSPHAKMYRGGGWGSKAIADMNAQATHARETYKDLIESVPDPEDATRHLTPKEAGASILEGLGYEAGRTGYLKPPSNLDELNGEIDNFLRTRATHQGAHQTSAEFFDPLIRDAEVNGQLDLAAQLKEMKDAGTKAEGAIGARGEKAARGAKIQHQWALQEQEQRLRAGIETDIVADEVRRADKLRAPQARQAVDAVGGDNVVYAPVQPEFFGEGLHADSIISDGSEGAWVRGVHMVLGDRTIEEAAAAVKPRLTQTTEQVQEQAAAAVIKMGTKAGTPARAAAEAEQLGGRSVDEVLAKVAEAPGAVSHEYAVFPTKVYRASEHPIDLMKENETAAIKMLDDAKAAKGEILDEAALSEVSDDAMRQVIERERNQELALINERWLRENGYGAYETEVGGTKTMVVLQEEGGNFPMARVDPHAAWQGQATMGAPRLLTDQVVSAVARIPRIAELPGGSRVWLEGLKRETATMAFDDAEKYIRTELGKVGVTLRSHQRVLDTDVYKAAKYTTQQTARDIVDMEMGASVKKLQTMGFFDSPFRGGVPGGLPFRYVVNDGNVAAWERYMGELKNAEVRAALHQQEVDIPFLRGEARNAQAELEATRHAIETEKGRMLAEVEAGRARAVGAETAARRVPAATVPEPSVVPKLTTSSSEVEKAMYRAQKETMFAASADEAYAYHYGPRANHESVTASGLKPSHPRDVTPKGPQGVYFGTSGQRAWDLIPAKAAQGEPVLYRVRRDAHDLVSSDRIMGYEGEEMFARKRVKPEDLEFYGSDGEWHPVKEGAPAHAEERVTAQQVSSNDASMAETAKVAYEEGRYQRAFDGLKREYDKAKAEAEKVGDNNPEVLLPDGTRVAMVRDFGDGRQIWRDRDELVWDETLKRWVDTVTLTASSGRVRYIGVENGVVKSVRELSGKKELADQTADTFGHTLKTAGVGALTDPAAQGQGWGSRLLDQHWSDAGVETWDDAEAMLRAQEYTTAGANLNKAKIDRMVRDKVKAAEKHQRQVAAAFDNAASERDGLIREVNRIATQAKAPGARPLAAIVPVENARNMTGFQTVAVKGVGSMAMPVFVAQEFVRASDGFKSLTGFHKQWRQFNSFWKSMATWMWPGFHIRNFMGAWFNNWLGGVGIKDYVTTWRIRKAAREIEREGAEGLRWSTMKVGAKDGDIISLLKRRGHTNLVGVPLDEVTYGDLAKLEDSMGLTAANGRAFAEAELPTEKSARLGGARSRVEKSRLPGWYAKGARGAGTMTENVFRTAAFVRGVRNYGELHEARLFTMLRHGDYADLTDFEYSTVRDVLPFYKWMRTNLPFQIHQLFESPGKLLAVKKGQEAIYDLQGRDYGKDKYAMPEWMQSSFTIPFGSSKDDSFNAVMLDLPMSDLFMGTREFASSFLPLARPIIESYIYEKSTFSGAPIEGAKVPLAGVFKPVAGLLDAVGLAEKGEDGNAYISDKTQNLLGMLPAFSRFRNWIYEDPDRVKLRVPALISAGFGVGLRPVDQDQMAATELDFYYAQILPAMEHQRQMGFPLPTTDDLEATYGSINTVLGKLGITPGVGGSAIPETK